MPLIRWTPDMDLKLVECRDAGMSYTAMAASGAFGDLTSNAIIGRAGRIGLVGVHRPAHHRAPQQKLVNKPKVPKLAKVKRAVPAAETKAQAMARIASGVGVPMLKPSKCEPIGGPVGWHMPDAGCCRWISGDRTPERDTRLWCGHPVVAGKSWCPEHLARTQAPRVLEDA